MPRITIDPFEHVRKNAHVWRGENCVIWYCEKLDGSFSVLILYDFDDAKHRLFLDVDNAHQKLEFKNDVLPEDLYEELKNDIEAVERILKTDR